MMYQQLLSIFAAVVSQVKSESLSRPETHLLVDKLCLAITMATLTDNHN